MLLGILSGLMAGSLWGFVFLAPKILTAYSSADVALGRYAVFGAISVVFLLCRYKRVKQVLTLSLALQAIGLSCLSFSIYYFMLASSVKYGGLVPASLLSGLLPITIPLFSRDKIARRNLFALSLTLIFCGLALLNAPLLFEISDLSVSSEDWLIGFILAAVAAAFWTAYAPLNAKVLARHPEVDSVTWSSLLGLFAFLTMLPVWFLFNTTDLSNASQHFLAWPYVMWMIIIGAGSSWLAIYCWNFACRRIPTGMAGQLIVSEVIFSLLYNYIYEWKLPALHEGAAAVILILGVLVGIRSFRGKAIVCNHSLPVGRLPHA